MMLPIQVLFKRPCSGDVPSEDPGSNALCADKANVVASLQKRSTETLHTDRSVKQDIRSTATETAEMKLLLHTVLLYYVYSSSQPSLDFYYQV